MGVGTNRVNRYTLGAATQGLCNYLNAQFPQGGLSVALAHDSRNNARAFASLVANVFSANGILVHFSKTSVRRQNCHSPFAHSVV